MAVEGDTGGRLIFWGFLRLDLPDRSVSLVARCSLTPHRRRGMSVLCEGRFDRKECGERREVEVVVTEDTTLNAYYRHQGRVVPDRPTEDDGDLE